MAHVYTKAQHNFIVSHCKGRDTYELTKMFNLVFNLNLRREQIRCYMQNHKLTSGLDRKALSKLFCKRKYTDEQIEFLKTIAKGTPRTEIHKLFNYRFNLDLNYNQIKAIMNNYKITNGIDGKLKKGNIPPNKGKKGIPSHPNAVATQFKKGQKPKNWMPVGSERVNGDGYVDIKIAEPNIWKGKHHIVWEQHNGAIPEGCAIIFGDRNRFNFNIDNLILVTKSQLAIMNRRGLIKNDTEITKTGLVIAKIYEKIKDSEKRLNER